jgi:hypothetical protein
VRRGETGFLRRMLDLRAGPARRLDEAAFLAMMRTNWMNFVSER